MSKRERREISFVLIRIHESDWVHDEIISQLYSAVFDRAGAVISFFGPYHFMTWGFPVPDEKKCSSLSSFCDLMSSQYSDHVSFVAGNSMATLGNFGTQKRIAFWAWVDGFEDHLHYLAQSVSGVSKRINMNG